MSPQRYQKRTGAGAGTGRLVAQGTTAMTAPGGCPGCGCAPLPAAATTTKQVARYDEKGNCESIFTISCETSWRVRECFKTAFCDFLYCVGENLCDDGKFKRNEESNDVEFGEILGSCLEVFVCSMVKCLPVAICGPRPGPVCPPPCPTLECDFAVEEIG